MTNKSSGHNTNPAPPGLNVRESRGVWGDGFPHEDQPAPPRPSNIAHALKLAAQTGRQATDRSLKTSSASADHTTRHQANNGIDV